MALSWTIENCTNWESLKSDEKWTMTNTFIWATMSIDMNEITEDNAIEFYARMKVVEFCNDGLVFEANEFGKRVPITYQHVTERIGLHTNAYSRNTFNQWFKRIAMVYSKTHSENGMKAAYYSAKAEVENLTERVSA
jgi:hypothetical protein